MDEVKHAELERRLDNWGAWARGGYNTGPRRCGSAEGRYLPSRDDEGERLEQSARIPINVQDAERVEHCLLRIRNRLERRLLVWWFVEHRDKVYLARKLNVPPKLVEPYVLKAMYALQYHLDHEPQSDRRQGKGLQSAKRSNMYESTSLNAGTAA